MTLLKQYEDKVVERVRAKLLERSKAGIEKYGCTMDRDDLDVIAWIKHVQEENLDSAVYAEKLIEMFEEYRSL